MKNKKIKRFIRMEKFSKNIILMKRTKPNDMHQCVTVNNIKEPLLNN